MKKEKETIDLIGNTVQIVKDSWIENGFSKIKFLKCEPPMNLSIVNPENNIPMSEGLEISIDKELWISKRGKSFVQLTVELS